MLYSKIFEQIILYGIDKEDFKDNTVEGENNTVGEHKVYDTPSLSPMTANS